MLCRKIGTMGLSTHVLDTMHGCPAAGMQVTLFAMESDLPRKLLTVALNSDGRAPGGPLLTTEQLRAGRYRLVFRVASYFRATGVSLPEPPFLDLVTLDFGVADPTQHHHVPLLCSPYSHSTYRGS